LRNEFTRRNVPNVEREPGKGVGLAMCILAAVSIIPVLGILTGIAGFVCWIVYWVKIAGYSALLGASTHLPGGPPQSSPGAAATYR
jgi:hypothetical protein